MSGGSDVRLVVRELREIRSASASLGERKVSSSETETAIAAILGSGAEEWVGHQ